MGQTCSTDGDRYVFDPTKPAVPTKEDELSTEDLTNFQAHLVKFPRLFTTVQGQSFSKKDGQQETYYVSCLLSSNIRSISFEVSDCKRFAWKKIVSLSKIARMKSVLDVTGTMKWKTFLKLFKRGFSQHSKGSLSVTFIGKNSKTPHAKRIRVCSLAINLTNIPVIKQTCITLNLMPTENPDVDVSRYFISPLFEYYSLQTDLAHTQKLKALEKVLDEYKEKYNMLVKAYDILNSRTDGGKNDAGPRLQMDIKSGNSNLSGPNVDSAHSSPINSPIRKLRKRPLPPPLPINQIRSDRARKRMISLNSRPSTPGSVTGDPEAERFMDINPFGHVPKMPKNTGIDEKDLNRPIMETEEVVSFLKELMKKLISQRHSINPKEHESLIHVIKQLMSYGKNTTKKTSSKFSDMTEREKKFTSEEVYVIREVAKVIGTNEEQETDGEKSEVIKTKSHVLKDSEEFKGFMHDVSNIGTSDARKQSLVMFEKVDDWNFDVFKLSRLNEGNTLFYTSFVLFSKYNLMKTFDIPEEILIQFLKEIESGYHPNDYHSSMHAADVTQISHFMILKGGVGELCTDLEILGLLTASLIHDYDHPGLNNQYQKLSGSYLAILYNDRSVLENHHVAQSFELLKCEQFNIFKNLSPEKKLTVRKLIIDLVLATDMEQHAFIVDNFKRLLERNVDFMKMENLNVALQIAIKIADVSNASRIPYLYLQWAQRIENEFYKQGDRERELEMKVSPFMDRDDPSLKKLQIAFISYLVQPMVKYFVMLFPKMEFAIENIKRNKLYWKYFDNADLSNLVEYEKITQTQQQQQQQENETKE